jgi:hypothetical protein
MRKIIGVLFALFFTFHAFAQPYNNGWPGRPYGYGYGYPGYYPGFRNYGRGNHPRKPKGPIYNIHGVCKIVKSKTHPLEEACVELTLILNDSTGKEVRRTKTDKDGKYEFAMDSGYPFHIISGVAAYDLIKPTVELYPGHYPVRLRQK